MIMMTKFQCLYHEASDDMAGGGDGGATATTATGVDSGAATPPAGLVNADGSFAEGWFSRLGDQYAPYAETAKNFRHVGDLVKSVVHLRGAGPKYPGEQATPDEVARFREAALVPKEAAGYGLSAPERLPDGVAWDQATADRFAEIAHKHHIPAPAMKALVAAQLEIEGGRAQQFRDHVARQQREAQDGLVAEWRGDYNANIQQARQFTGRIADAAGLSQEDAARLASDPAFARVAVAMSKLTAEDAIRAPAMAELRSARQRADEIMRGTDSQWGRLYQEGNRQAMEVVTELLRRAE